MNEEKKVNGNCIFCKIIKKELPATILHEDDHTLTILDITPINKGHSLVIPKQHYEILENIDDETRNELFKTVQHVAKAVKQGMNSEGINIGMNNGTAAGQTVMHAHVHIIPRWFTDGLKNWHGGTYAKGQSEDIAQRIRKEI